MQETKKLVINKQQLKRKTRKMLFNPSNSTTGFLLQTMLYVANITKNDLNRPKVFDDFKVSPMGADSGEFFIFSLALRIF